MKVWCLIIFYLDNNSVWDINYVPAVEQLNSQYISVLFDKFIKSLNKFKANLSFSDSKEGSSVLHKVSRNLKKTITSIYNQKFYLPIFIIKSIMCTQCSTKFLVKTLLIKY